jgi:parallel beta-helix repeat protein
LRHCLSNANAGDTITFDEDVFPPSSPATIIITNGPLPVDEDDIEVDGSRAGVVISGGSQLSSTDDGLRITSDNTTIEGVTIQNFPSDGVEIRDGAHGTRIENCTIRDNRKRGVTVAGSNTTGNTITHNSITSNTLMGILLSDEGNAWITRPFIYSVVNSNEQLTITGWATPTAVAEVFTDPGGEGATFLGQTMADVKGRFSLNVADSVSDGDNLTATATDANGNTSEFGCYPLPRPELVWPLSGTSAPGGEFSSPYGLRHQASKDRYDWHRGLDITATVGSPVYAVAAGAVRFAGDSPGYQDTVVQIEHEGGAYYSNYLHLSVVTVTETQDVD